MARGATAIHESCESSLGDVADIIGTIIGFAIPIVSLTVGFVLFIICVAVALISIIRYTKNK